MLTKAFLSIDLYTKNIHFTSSQQRKTSTIIGGIISLIVYLGSFAIALIYVIELITSSPHFFSYIESSFQNSPKLIISKESLSFGFGIIDSDLFQYKIIYNDGTYTTEIATKKCNQTDFYNMSFTGENSTGMINEMNCPVGNYSLILQGDYDDNIKSIMSIEIIKNNSIEEGTSNKTLRLLFGTINYDLNNQSNLFSYGLNSRKYKLDTSYRTNINCHLSSQTLKMNTNIFNNQHQTNTSIRIDNISAETSTLVVDPGSDQSIIATIRFISSRRYFIYAKRGLKLLEAMSIVGGNIYLLAIIGKAISFIFEQANNNLKILNAVFDFSSLNDSNNLMIMPKVKISEELLQKSNLQLKEDKSIDGCVKDKSILKTSDIFPSLNFATDNISVNHAYNNNNNNNSNNNHLNNIKHKNDCPRKTMVSIDDNLEFKLKKMIAVKRARELSQKKLMSLSTFEIIQLNCCCHFNRLFNYKKQTYLDKIKHIDNLMRLDYYFDRCMSIEKLQTVLLKKGHYGILSLLSREMIEKNNYNKPLSILLNDQVAFDNNIIQYLTKLKQPNYSFSHIDKKIIKMITSVSI